MANPVFGTLSTEQKVHTIEHPEAHTFRQGTHSIPKGITLSLFFATRAVAFSETLSINGARPYLA